MVLEVKPPSSTAATTKGSTSLASSFSVVTGGRLGWGFFFSYKSVRSSISFVVSAAFLVFSISFRQLEKNDDIDSPALDNKSNPKIMLLTDEISICKRETTVRIIPIHPNALCNAFENPFTALVAPIKAVLAIRAAKPNLETAAADAFAVATNLEPSSTFPFNAIFNSLIC